MDGLQKEYKRLVRAYARFMGYNVKLRDERFSQELNDQQKAEMDQIHQAMAKRVEIMHKRLGFFEPNKRKLFGHT